ncbi:S9 family peptidase [Salarchaeum japonicum]|uniref:S9 family peptidase n=1 Tax=Salarchaeum japonicum TaxID=555573 RepID=A0AAV3SZ14_9EURY|nr:S9 family peptidase [Salarchaeum japonicum]
MTTAVELEELASLPEFYHPRVSPDGDRVAFYYDETGRNELYVQDIASGERTQVSDGNVPRAARWPIAWDADGERVFFHQDEGGDEQNDIHAMTLDGEVEVVVEVDGQAAFHDVTSDGRYVLYGSDEGEQMNLYRYDTREDETEQLTAYDQPVHGGQFGPDEERVAYVANETDALENRDAYVMNADGSEKRKLDIGEVGAEAYPNDWHPDGDRLLVSDNTTDLGRVGVYDLDTDDVEWLSSGEYEESGAAFGPDGDTVVASRVRNAATMPVEYGLESGDVTAYDLDEGVAGLAGDEHFDGEGRAILAHTTSDERKTLYAYDRASDGTETLIAPAYGDIDPDTFVESEYVTYESEDGLEIGALLYDSGERPSPAVVMVHGGPHAHSMPRFDLYAQFLVSRGYTVLQPNYRGSTGRGREFKHRIHNDWGGGEQADVAAGGEWLQNLDWVDSERVAVMGGSYGGYSAYWQMVQYPELWATGIAQVGITDLLQMYENSMPHFQSMLEQQLGDPEENEEFWRERSPLTHVENIQNPILIVHGVNDPRCPIDQARVFRDALLDMGWTEGEDGDFEYEELGAEGHGSTDIDQKIRQFTLVDDFLDRRL